MKRILMALGALAGIAAGQEGAPPEAPSQAASVGKWVEALGSPSFAEREKAGRALVEAGPAAVEALKKAAQGGNAEVSARAQELLDEVEVREKIRLLRKARKADEWERLRAEIVKAGDLGVRLLDGELEKALAGTPLEIRDLPARAKRGEGIPAVLRIRNEGKTGGWVKTGTAALPEVESRKWSAEKSLEDPRELEVLRGGPGAKQAIFLSVQRDAAPCLYLEPGEACGLPVRIEGKGLDCVGRMRFKAQWNGRTAESGWVDLLPDWKGASSPGVTLAYGDKGNPAVSEGAIPVRLVLGNGAGKPLALPDPMQEGKPRGFWYLLVDSQGEIRQCGSLGDSPSSAEPVLLAPSRTLEASGRIVPAVPPGKYTLVCGYSVGTSERDVLLKGGALRASMRAAQPAPGAVPGRRRAIEARGTEWIGDALAPPKEIEIR